RKKESLDAPEEILFDCNEMAKGFAYFKLGSISVSPDNTMACFSIDTVSRRQYTLQVKNLITGEIYADKIKNTTGSASWANDNKTLFYTKKDRKTLRAYKIFKHRLFSDVKQDVEIYHETDDTFNTYIYKTKSRKYLVIGSSSTLTTEYRILNADTPDGEFKVFEPRTRGHEYSFSHFKDHFYIVSNKDNAENFKLLKTPSTATESTNWQEVIPHRENVLIEDI